MKVDERFAVTDRDLVYFSDKDRVIAAVKCISNAALNINDRVVERRHAAGGPAYADTDEFIARRERELP